MSEKRKPNIGDHVIIVDKEGQSRNGLVTTTFEGWQGNDGVNAVIVHKDEERTDSYGRQIDREYTSVPHKNEQAAPGYYWCWPDEQ